MKWLERQERVEREVYNAIDDLADEIGLKVLFYPEVYWLGRTIKFEDIGFPNRLEDEFVQRASSKQSSCYPKQNTIIINKYRWHDIFEESSHFVHLSNSQLDLEKKTFREGLWTNVVVEMLGFLGARILGSGVRNGYFKLPDLMRYYSSEKDFFNLKQDGIDGIDLSDHNNFYLYFIYQQGYCLGDVLFTNAVSGNVKNREIRGLFKDNLEGKNKSRDKVLELRERFWKMPV